MANIMDAHTDVEVQRHLALVLDSSRSATGEMSDIPNIHRLQAIGATPIFSRMIKEKMVYSKVDGSVFPIYGHLGLRLATYTEGSEAKETPIKDNLLYTNINAPWSAFICGSQGAGKSHTLSCILENALMNDGNLGPNPNPLAGILFHYDKHAGQEAGQICEAAYLASDGIEVEIFVSPSNFWAMRELYDLPGISKEKQPKVRPLLLHERHINIANMRALTNIDSSDDRPPLYMAVVNKILRSMAIDRKGAIGLDYTRSTRDLAASHLNPSRLEHLNMRLQLLESFLHRSANTKFQKMAGERFSPRPGALTIIDLSCPFATAGDACMLFSICLSLFLGSRKNYGSLIALDEAHKFLSENSEAQGFTEDLLQVIRQQRHLRARVIIATQEPTLSPDLLDLCNVTIVHRFQSQAWYSSLKSHLATLSTRHEDDEVFNRIVDLENDEALVFCPTAYLDVEGSSEVAMLKPLRSSYVKLRVRERITRDGGKSFTAMETFLGKK